jgi:hypothetical protein
VSNNGEKPRLWSVVVNGIALAVTFVWMASVLGFVTWRDGYIHVLMGVVVGAAVGTGVLGRFRLPGKRDE